MPEPSATDGFSLVGGGRWRRLLAWLGLAGPSGRVITKEALVLAGVTWLPLLVLSLAQGLALTPRVKVPFLHDLSAYIRFLVSLPLLVLAQAIIDRWCGKALEHILTSGLVEERERPEVESAVRTVSILRESAIFEVVILLLAYARPIVALISGLGEPFASWRVPSPPHGLSAAGWWFLLVSLPLFNFLLYRWVWGFLIWAFFLWRLSWLPLQLIPTHPDRGGGLTFLGDIQMRFAPGVAALSALLAAFIEERALFQGVAVPRSESLAIGFVVVATVIVLAPLLVFIPRLTASRTQGLLDYSVLGHQYTEAFHRKWVEGPPPVEEPLLGTSDIQSLADIANSFAVIREMRVVPLDAKIVAIVLAAAIIPLLPLVFAVLPAADVLKKLAGVFFR